MQITTERGVITRSDDNSNASAFIPTEITTGETSEFAASIAITLKYLHDGFAQNATKYRDEHRIAENGRLATATIPALRQPIEKALEIARNVAAATARSGEPSEKFDPVYESAFVSSLRTLSIAERTEAVLKLNYAASSALIRNGDLYRFGLPQSVIDNVLRNHQIEKHLATTSIRASHAKRPTLNDPLAIGVDEASARDATVAALRQLQQRQENVQLAADAIRSVAIYIAAMTNKTPEVVWAEFGVS